MKVSGLQAFIVKLPFRFAFKHSLASRNFSENLIVRAQFSDGAKTYTGWGEGIPRDYVTGETVEQSVSTLQKQFFPAIEGQEVFDSAGLLRLLRQQFLEFAVGTRAIGATWCALELALLDAFGQARAESVSNILGGVKKCHEENGIQYGAVIPFGGKRAVTAILLFYKAFGFKTVKLKLGKNDEADLELVQIARRILGDDVIVRVDVNCAWTVEQTIGMAEKMRPYNVASIEQPVPADDWAGLARITREIPEPIMVDESLCTVEQARALAAEKVCGAFNVRISKVGGILAAQTIVDIARTAGLQVQMGAQVGESGILSAAGRMLAAVNEPFENCEGSNNLFLLKRDLTLENLNVSWGGRGAVLKRQGLGVTVKSDAVSQLMNVSEVDNRKLVPSN